MNHLRYLSLLIIVLASITACTKKKPAGIAEAIDWNELPGWQTDNHAQAWPALLQSCKVLRKKYQSWQAICEAANKLPQPSDLQAKEFFQTWFRPHRIYNETGGSDGLITGYYEPLLEGSLTKSKDYKFPLYKWPDDLLIVDLSSLYPELKHKRLRGRVVGKRVVPYYSRAEIDQKPELLQGHELVWLKDPVALFFLQIQGSGKVILPDKTLLPVGYHQQNGHPYVAIGKTLIDRGELRREDVSLESIRNWLKNNPDHLFEILHSNPSYVFFKKLDQSLPGPLGAMNIPLTPERSIAIDPKKITLGIPIWLNTNLPNKNPNEISEQKYQRLMFAQDTGGAINGAVRADVFWGSGERAEFYAGHMKQTGELFALLPKPQNQTN